ncbi:protein HIDE1 isoform X1 [Alligator sinensis]|uniref:protein HIDE1 isoform X1 n=1 Tax=Alligator sinensis TaxID=38654 RepID=A0A1U7RHJ8_ALLSI|nr:protein HIDE1 isoform X1 [Alligator sinensis]XP_025059716.1 protein HIDE1 isoform X1 [Alligator sinensis]
MPSRKASLRFLFLVAGSLAALSRAPMPLAYLATAAEDIRTGDSISICCTAPSTYLGSWFDLLRTDVAEPLQSQQAPHNQHNVTFMLGSVTAGDSGHYYCRYHYVNGTALVTSNPSNMVEILVPGPGWFLPMALSVAGAVLLALVLLAVVVTKQVKARRQQIRRDQDSCWTETGFPTTELSFDNGVFVGPVKSDREAMGSPGTCLPPGPQKRLTSATSTSSQEMPEFSTFKALE